MAKAQVAKLEKEPNRCMKIAWAISPTICHDCGKLIVATLTIAGVGWMHASKEEAERFMERLRTAYAKETKP